MANSLIRGLLAKGVSATSIIAADVDSAKLEQLNNDCGIRTENNQSLADAADIVVLAVKPQVMEQVCRSLTLQSESTLVVSIAAGITIDQLQSWLGNNSAIVRCMPNTPALVGKGASGLYANAQVTNRQKELATALMDSVGISAWVGSEEDIDSVTAVSGSGPAYYFLFIEAMQEAASELGLDDDIAKRLIYQTAIGAAELALQSSDSAAELRRKVTSPGGTTEQAINTFESGDLRALVKAALQAAKARSIELAEVSKK